MSRWTSRAVLSLLAHGSCEAKSSHRGLPSWRWCSSSAALVTTRTRPNHRHPHRAVGGISCARSGTLRGDLDSIRGGYRGHRFVHEPCGLGPIHGHGTCHRIGRGASDHLRDAGLDDLPRTRGRTVAPQRSSAFPAWSAGGCSIARFVRPTGGHLLPHPRDEITLESGHIVPVRLRPTLEPGLSLHQPMVAIGKDSDGRVRNTRVS